MGVDKIIIIIIIKNDNNNINKNNDYDGKSYNLFSNTDDKQ